MKKRITAVIAAVAMSMTMLAGCGGSEAPAAGAAQTAAAGTGSTTAAAAPAAAAGPSEGAKIKDELHIAFTQEPPTLDMHIGTEATKQMIVRGTIYETLVTRTGDYGTKPELAEEVTSNADNTEYVYKLRQGVKFHNGEEMKAEDVAASMNRWKEHNSNAAEMLGDASFEVVDDYTVKIALDKPCLFVNELIASTSAVMPKSVIDDADPTTGYVKSYVGTGPYVFSEWKDNQYISMERFEDYQPYGTKGEFSGNWGYKSAPTKTLYYDVVPDSATMSAGLQTGEYDVAYQLPEDNYDLFTDPSEYTIYKEVSGAFVCVYNKKSGLTQDVNIRQAVNAILNPDDIMMGALSSQEFFRKETSYMGEEMANWYSTAGEEFAFRMDEALAKDYLAKAGYNGEPYRILVNSANKTWCNAAVVVQQELESIGMNVEIVTVDSTTYSAYRSDPSKYEMFFTNALPQAVPSLQIFLSPAWAGFTDDAQIKQSLAEMNASADIASAKKIWDEAQKYCWETYLPVTKLASSFNYSATGAGVKDYVEFNGPVVVNAYAEE